jgi:ketosteroid isomerase-like protein
MKRHAWIVAFTLATCAVVAGASVEDQVAQAEKAWSTAILKKDYASLDHLLSDDLTYTHSSGVVEGKSVYFGRLRSGTVNYETIQYEGITVKAYGNTAVLHCKARMKAVADGKLIDVYAVMMHIWAKQGGVWKLVAHQATNLPLPASGDGRR